MALYVGEADSTMDDKNRLTIPKKFRKLMSDDADADLEVWVIPGYGDADFMIMDSDHGGRWAQTIMKVGIGGGKVARKKRLLALSERVEVDKQGRALIPQNFLERCNVTAREFKVAGHGDYLAVYSPSSWQRFQASLSKDELDGLWDDAGSGDASEMAGDGTIE
ncbi:MAG: hypothetical protein HUU29_01560 [Planctomycetaceae bacterium]|nr:hypothetical protein [Planctomycetaceae bacterium]